MKVHQRMQGLGDAWAGTEEGRATIEPVQQVVITGQAPGISRWLPLILVALAVILIANASEDS